MLLRKTTKRKSPSPRRKSLATTQKGRLLEGVPFFVRAVGFYLVSGSIPAALRSAFAFAFARALFFFFSPYLEL